MKLNRTVTNLFFLIIIFVLPSCATIVGGSDYYAHVNVNNHPNAIIKYNGVQMGTGSATFKVKRAQANQFALRIEKEGCESENFMYMGRTFRGWAFFGSLVGWTFMVDGVPLLPIGILIDAATGSLWKPDIKEKGVGKMDYDNFTYHIDYSKCPTDNARPIIVGNEKTQLLRELKDLYDQGIISEEEFEAEKKKILEMDY